jgi:hypothetical protein
MYTRWCGAFYNYAYGRSQDGIWLRSQLKPRHDLPEFGGFFPGCRCSARSYTVTRGTNCNLVYAATLVHGQLRSHVQGVDSSYCRARLTD